MEERSEHWNTITYIFHISYAVYTNHNAVAHNSPKSIWIWLQRNGIARQVQYAFVMALNECLRELWLAAAGNERQTGGNEQRRKIE